MEIKEGSKVRLKEFPFQTGKVLSIIPPKNETQSPIYEVQWFGGNRMFEVQEDVELVPGN